MWSELPTSQIIHSPNQRIAVDSDQAVLNYLYGWFRPHYIHLTNSGLLLAVRTMQNAQDVKSMKHTILESRNKTKFIIDTYHSEMLSLKWFSRLNINLFHKMTSQYIADDIDSLFYIFSLGSPSLCVFHSACLKRSQRMKFARCVQDPNIRYWSNNFVI